MTDIPDIAQNIQKTATILSRLADSSLQQKYGIGITQFKILQVLHGNPEGVLQNNIASRLNQTEAAISRQISLMKNKGLIIKSVTPNNRRNRVITLSSEGKATIGAAIKELKTAYKPSFTVLNPAEQDLLNSLINKLVYSAPHYSGEN